MLSRMNKKDMNEIKSYIDKKFDELREELLNDHVSMFKEIFSYHSFFEEEREKKGNTNVQDKNV